MSKTVNLGVKSAIARLLATENIQVTQTNSKTAWFDVEKRVLNLPLWDVETYVYDMLVGHEVGHALFTPADGWHDSIVDLGIPRSYINVVEDARIEKHIKSKYPGLVFTFSRAYKWMHDQDFFKIAGRNIFKMKLIDRINLHFKLGASLVVPFAADEKVLVDKVARCESFDDVVAVSKEILDFWKDRKEDLLEDLAEQMESAGVGDDQDDDLYDDTEMFGDEDQMPDEDMFGSTEADGAKETPDEDPSAEDTKSVKGAGGGTDNNDEVSDTDEALRSNESQMLSSERGGILKLFSEKLAMEAMVPYKTYHSAPRTTYIGGRGVYKLGFNRWDHDDPAKAFEELVEVEFRKFMAETNRAVSYMAKEFEQKKAAYQYSRAKTSTSGVLNTSALHKYKFSEDVFKRITTLANAKSHGMVISIDMSGSMSDVLHDTVKQALNLALFCRRVNIPFEMYGFTSDSNLTQSYNEKTASMLSGTLDPYGMHYIQFFSHKMKKHEFETAVKNVYKMSLNIMNDYDSLGSTPTNEMLVALSYQLKKFRKETGVQKVMNIVLTDGEPNRSTVFVDYNDRGQHGGNYNLLQLSPTKVVRIQNAGSDLSTKLLNYLKTECQVTNVGYFLGDSSALKNQLYRITKGDYKATNDIRTGMRKDGGYSVDNVMGYDRYIFIRSNNFGIQDEEFEVAEDAKKSTLAREFTKYTKGKRTSRVLLDRFVQAIA